MRLNSKPSGTHSGSPYTGGPDARSLFSLCTIYAGGDLAMLAGFEASMRGSYSQESEDDRIGLGSERLVRVPEQPVWSREGTV